MTDKIDYRKKIARLETLLAEERANAKMLLEVVRKQIITLETQREMLRELEAQNGD
ncbi:hypothetical protein [Acidithiobacillus albertensis]|uniref:hypothetical protein n=1 Tax=Acidithiobacillus albertensis TaxID=119978 RepID=UPI000A866767|nr:hypothetical protein [Acidithiobacillus albertensis]